MTKNLNAKIMLLCATASLALLSGCGEKKQEAKTPEITASAQAAATSPFFKDWDAPFAIPPFADIKDADYAPAFDIAIAEFEKEIATLSSTDEAPTFENTIIYMEEMGADLSRVSRVFGNITNTDTNDALQELERTIYPRLSKVYDSITLDDAIWQRVNTLYETRDTLGLNAADMRLLELYHRDFVRSGAALSPKAKARMSEINSRMSELTTNFGQNLLKETKSFEMIVTDEAELAGVSKGLKQAAKAAAEDKGYKDSWLFGLDRSVYESFMTEAENRDLREKLFRGYTERASGGANDNGPIILEIARLRAEAAQLRGYKSHAQFQLETRMAKTPEIAEDFLLKVWRPGLVRAKQELADMQALAEAQGGDYQVRASDWWHLAEKVRQDKYAFDDGQLKPYFELNNVREGSFYVANKLWGVTFEKLENVPVWNPEVVAYDMKDENGVHLGVYMTDNFARDSKRGGAWMSSYRSTSNINGNDIRPLITNNLNLVKPAAGDPALMSFDEVETLFHEFGHGLHGMMTKQKYERYSGTSGPRDYTEFPAQIMEHWAGAPEVLEVYAKHVETGEIIPQELIAKMRNASTFNQGFKTTEFIAASLLDLRWHMLSLEEAEAITDARAFEQQVLAEYGLIPEIEPRYRSPYFSHIFAGGYSAGYYAYLWSEILDADGFTAFREAGNIFDPTLAQRLRENVFEAGGKQEADELYRQFRGKDPSIEPLLEIRGLKSGT